MGTCIHCDRPVKAVGMCAAHYGRMSRYGVAVGCKREGCDGAYYQSGLCRRHKRPRCEVCDRRAEVKGLCSAHYLRLRRTGDVQADVPIGDLGKPDVPEWENCETCGAESWAGGRWCERCVHAALDERRAA